MEPERLDMRRLARAADGVSRMILTSDMPDVDIEIAKNRVREMAEELFPDRGELFSMIYESRWDRLSEQFRRESEFEPFDLD
jgi:hypothetical protein